MLTKRRFGSISELRVSEICSISQQSELFCGFFWRSVAYPYTYCEPCTRDGKPFDGPILISIRYNSALYQSNVQYEYRAFAAAEAIFDNSRAFDTKDYVLPLSSCQFYPLRCPAHNDIDHGLVSEFLHLQSMRTELKRLDKVDCLKAYSNGRRNDSADLVLITKYRRDDFGQNLFLDLDTFRDRLYP